MHPQITTKSGAFTFVELLITITVTATLAALFMPAILRSLESARSAQCANNFRQIGIGMQQYLAARHRFPSNVTLPWTIDIAPYLENTKIFQEYDQRYDAYSSQHNQELGRYSQPFLCCPSDGNILIQPQEWPASNVAGSIDLLRVNVPANYCTDGDSNTGLAVEIGQSAGLAQVIGPAKFLGPQETAHPCMFKLLFVSGTVRSLNTEIDPALMEAIRTPRGGEAVQLPE